MVRELLPGWLMGGEMRVRVVIPRPWNVIAYLFFRCLSRFLPLFDFLAMLHAGEFQKLVINFLNIKLIIPINTRLILSTELTFWIQAQQKQIIPPSLPTINYHIINKKQSFLLIIQIIKKASPLAELQQLSARRTLLGLRSTTTVNYITHHVLS